MSYLRIEKLSIKNYRSFWNNKQTFEFPGNDYKKPTVIVWYNNAWKSNLINSILYGLNINFVSKDTFSIDDFHNRIITNKPEIELWCDSSEELKYDRVKKANLKWFHKLEIKIDWNEIAWSTIKSYSNDTCRSENYQAFWANRYFSVFYINFHNIKEEISTQKSSRWSLKSFLAKHIKRITESDELMNQRKGAYQWQLKQSTNTIMSWSMLEWFVSNIKTNYTNNLRDNPCEIQFWLPEYEDIFLKMMFMIWLNWDDTNLVPINHFWDWYISMFVMAVIQAIADHQHQYVVKWSDTLTSIASYYNCSIDELKSVNWWVETVAEWQVIKLPKDKCLFIFEEPESFLHENHQEYFYKRVLCKLSQDHQVIYTTHSDKMVDIFDTRWLIILEFDETTKQTINKYNNTAEYSPVLESPLNITDDQRETYNKRQYNNYICSIEPNINKILFSRKVIFVEWPNDLLVYSTLINQLTNHNFWECYLNYYNISIIAHHGKPTVQLLIDICNRIKLDYYVITDLDFIDTSLITNLRSYTTEAAMKAWWEYNDSQYDFKKWMITTLRKLINKCPADKIHFNVPKLETMIWYNADTKNPLQIWKKITTPNFVITDDLFPQSLKQYLEFTAHWI